MAQKVNIVLVDDIDGSEASETINLGLDGTSYEIDLSDDNAKKLREALLPYVNAARKAGRKTGTAGKRSNVAGRTNAKEELANIRAWAKENGYEVSDRGRIRAEIVEAFHAAQ